VESLLNAAGDCVGLSNLWLCSATISLPYRIAFMIIGTMILIALVYWANTKSKLNKTCRRLARLYDGTSTPAGWADYPTIRFRHRGTDVFIDFGAEGGGDSGDTIYYTQVHMRWPDTRFRCEIYREDAFSRVGKFLGMQDVEIGSPAFDRDYIIKSNDIDQVRSFLSEGVQRQICALDYGTLAGWELLGIHVSVRDGVLLVKQESFTRAEFDALSQLTNAALKLYDFATVERSGWGKVGRATDATPNIDATYYYNRGMAWLEKGEPDKAIADFNEAIRLDPKYALAYYNRGSAWDDKGESDKEIADYNEAIRLDPKNVYFYYDRGLAWDDKGEYDKAISDFTEVIRLDPKNPSAYSVRGSAWEKKDEFDQAISDFTEVIRLDPKNPSTYGVRGNAWVIKGEFDQAISDYTEAIQLDPKYEPAYNTLAWLQATCSDPSYRDGRKAVKNARKAGKLTNWKNGYSFGILAAAYAEIGDFDEAVKWQEKELEMALAEFKADFRSRLDLYKAHKPYRKAHKPYREKSKK